MKDNMISFKTKKGYVSLITTLIVGSLSVLVTLGMLAVGMIQTQTAIVFSDASRSAMLADACVEYALQEIRDDTNFSGTGSIVVAGNGCNYEVLSLGSESRTINADSTINDVAKKVQVSIDAINPLINVTAWTFVE